MREEIEKLLEPFNQKKFELKNRMVMAPMVTNYANKDGSVSDRLVAYYKARALGGVALILVEAAYVHPTGKGYTNQLGIHEEKTITGLKRLADIIHSHGSKAFLQLDHSGRQTNSSITGSAILAPSSIPCTEEGEIPVELNNDSIKSLADAFSLAALRAKQASFDGIQLNGAHGSLLAQFLSPYSNSRTDQYGGSLENRMRFPLEVVNKVREAVGSDYLLTYRFSAEEYVEGGLTLDEARPFAQELEKVGVDGLSVSAGFHLFNMMTIQPMGIPQGCLANLSGEIKKVVNVPVVVAGRINDPLVAERILKSGQSDLVALGRALIADADFPNKVAKGDLDSVRICIACNQECSGRLIEDQDVLCLINAQTGNEDKLSLEKTHQPKKVLVAGGGAAGLEAATAAARRGHDVYLFEKTEELGGKLASVALPPRKEVIYRLRNTLIHHVKNYGVKIKLNTEVTPELIEEINPDVVLLTTGSNPNMPPIPGIQGGNVFTADDVLNKKVETGQKVAVLGNGLVGAETADWLSELGKEVVLIGKSLEVAPGAEPLNKLLMLEALKKKNVTMLNGAGITEILPDGVVIEINEEAKEIHNMDTIVVALGYRPNNVLQQYVESKGIPIYVAGDCVRPRRIAEAVHEGFKAGLSI